jgi:hypothetical protein
LHTAHSGSERPFSIHGFTRHDMLYAWPLKYSYSLRYKSHLSAS